MVSGHTPSNVYPEAVGEFCPWRRAFERKLREWPHLQQSFSEFVEAGCNHDDLERALFWVVLNLHISTGPTPNETRDFFDLVGKILPKLAEMRTNLDALLSWRSQNEPVPGFDLHLNLLDHLFPDLHIPQQRDRILTIPGLLDHLGILLRATQGMFEVDARQLAAAGATVPEVLLIEYVMHATRCTSPMDEILDRIGEHQRLAFEAYEVEGAEGRVYEGGTWARRYRRFKEAERKKSETIVSIVEDFLARKTRGECISLIPFFVDSYSPVVRSLIVTGEPGNKRNDSDTFEPKI